MDEGRVYQQKIDEEVARFREVTNVHDLPEIFHYWSNKHLLPNLRRFGLDSGEQFYLGYMSRACLSASGLSCNFLSTFLVSARGTVKPKSVSPKN